MMSFKMNFRNHFALGTFVGISNRTKIIMFGLKKYEN